MKILSLIALSISLIFVSSCSNKKKINEEKSIPTKALFVVFNSTENPNFWKEYESSVFNTTKTLYDSKQIAYVLPFSHKSLKHPEREETWTNSIMIGLNSNKNYLKIAQKIITQIEQSNIESNLKTADIMQLQDGLDLFYSIENGLEDEPRLEQIVEYVFSDPTARKKYYEEQYVFSGPAMNELHKNNMAGRFIGFELEQRLSKQDFPQWDLIHIVGFTKEQTEKATPVFFSTWNKYAEKAFGEGMTFQKKKSEWDKIRLNIKSNAEQKMNVSFPLVE